MALISTLLALSLLSCAHAHDNGMDMDMDGPMSLSMGNMLAYLHFTTGDNLWFLGWVPKSAGAMVGTCLGLFMLALLERWLSAMRAVMEAHWNNRAQILLSNRHNTQVLPDCHAPEQKARSRTSALPPFIPAHDIPRGIMQIAISALGFLFMLAVMTFQVSFILSIVVGLGVGETLFGRYSITSSMHQSH
ncbi:hypothetical protein FA95DRAFT_1489909 [Auriscalpium vulgare]|uniref:Uncharacterized protein n=1 Tax=Auriscalpium vulgare TaxID=40419 RepID=A0ACB8RYC2_9AGAM|nr:hypothetical protein FA95DRAFT_1489909 [Auriscalpium vulgare]